MTTKINFTKIPEFKMCIEYFDTDVPGRTTAGYHTFKQFLDDKDNAWIVCIPDTWQQYADTPEIKDVMFVIDSECNWYTPDGKIAGTLNYVGNDNWLFQSERECDAGNAFTYMCKSNIPYDCEREVILAMVAYDQDPINKDRKWFNFT